MRRVLRRFRELEPWIVLSSLALLAAGPLLRAPGYLAGLEPVGDDASSHVLASATLARHLAAWSSGWWMDGLNLGFPLAHFYQPLPHLTTGLVALALGGPEEATAAYKLIVLALLAALPFSAYLGLRRAGLDRVGALAAAIALASLSAPKAYFGLTARHFLLVGLNTLLWGAVLAPLALGEGLRFLAGRGRASLAVGSFALLFLGHALLALGLVPVFVFAALLARGKDGPTLGRSLGRVVLLGGLTGCAIAFWLLPQLMCSDYFGGWPTGNEERVDGFGLSRVLREWGRGKLTDFHRAPVLAWLSIAGLGVCALRVRERVHRVVLFGVALFVVFTAGRVTFGSLVDWVFPPNRRIEGMMRWVAMLHLFLAALAGLGAAGLASLGRRVEPLRRRPWIATAAVALVLLAATRGQTRKDLDWGLDTRPDDAERGAWLHVAQALAAERRPGRLFSSEGTGHGSHWDMAYLAHRTGRPAGLSLGVGVQDSLNYYYLHGFDPLADQGRGLAQAALYNFRYLLLEPGADAGLGARVVAQRGSHRLVELPGEYGYFDLVDEPVVVRDAKPALLRHEFRRWLDEELPRGGRFRRLAEPVAVAFPSLPSATLDFADRQRAAQAGGPAGGPARPRDELGRIVRETLSLSRYEARAQVVGERAWLLLKVTPHPFWQARVDGLRRDFYTLSPAFMGLELEPGEHDVVFEFVAPAWQKLLLAGSALLMTGLVLLDRKNRPEPEPGVPGRTAEQGSAR